jgi:hypothetical protein
MEDAEIVRLWTMALRCYRRGTDRSKMAGVVIADRLEDHGVTEADIDRLFPHLANVPRRAEE